jgi:ABC-2 type transport system permease protein
LRKWFLPSDIGNCNYVNTSNVLTANYASTALQVCLGTLKAGIEMETLRKQGTPEKLLATQYEPFKTTFIKPDTNYMYFLIFLLLGLALALRQNSKMAALKN